MDTIQVKNTDGSSLGNRGPSHPRQLWQLDLQLGWFLRLYTISTHAELFGTYHPLKLAWDKRLRILGPHL